VKGKATQEAFGTGPSAETEVSTQGYSYRKITEQELSLKT